MYEVFVFTFRLFRKCIRVGWMKKGAVIILHKGMNIKGNVIESDENAYNQLLEFAVKHQIDFYKTKDFVILEK
ncbi:hypothetical protein [Bacillus weihaiensis]|uniref:hypothetical protein n=1 Tax=Bacillus weihaiensis TaxID=1547283 RepID=UPI0011AB3713|nr:hypothetical protein [Bacillus weihaiensis]